MGRNIRITFVVITILIAAGVLIACGGGGGGNGGEDTTAPSVNSWTPVGDEIVDGSASITIFFSESMDPGSILFAGDLGSESYMDTWTTTVFENDTLIITPTSSWTGGLARTITVDGTDIAGNPLAQFTLSMDIFNPGQTLLVVDDDQGLNNRAGMLGFNPDVDHIYTDDLDATSYSTYNLHTVYSMGDGPDISALMDYRAVVWFTGMSLGDAFGDNITLTETDIANLSSYLDMGGRLFLSSTDLFFGLESAQSGTTTPGTFAPDYLGVLDFYEIDDPWSTTNGVIGDPVSSSWATTGMSGPMDVNNWVIYNFETSDTVASESGDLVWDTTGGHPGTLQLTATSSSFSAGPVYSGEIFSITALDDVSLAFSSYDFWSCPNNDSTVFNAGSNWVRWDSSLGTNHYFSLTAFNTPPFTYYLEEKNGIVHEGLSDYINQNGFPSYAHTLLTDGGGNAVGSRVEGDVWKTIFVALPYEGLGPASDRREFLEKSLDWLLMEAPAGTP